ncbi:MAG: hypothetical protein ABIO35_08570, partial [Nitrobacter sp.]
PAAQPESRRKQEKVDSDPGFPLDRLDEPGTPAQSAAVEVRLKTLRDTCKYLEVVMGSCNRIAPLVLAAVLFLPGAAEAQVMQRKVVIPPAAPTTPAQTLADPTDAEKAADGTVPGDPGSDPAGTPPGTPPTEPPAEPPAEPAPAPPVQSLQRPAPPPREGLGVQQVGSNSPAVMIANWESMPGCGRRISIAALDQIWLIGCGPDPRKDIAIFRWNDGQWDLYPFAGRSIAAVSQLPKRKNKFGNLDSGVVHINSNYGAYFTEARLGYSPDPGDNARYSLGPFQDISSGGGWIWGVLPPEGNHAGGRIVRSDGMPGTCSDLDWGWCTEYSWSAPFGSLLAKRIAAGVTDATAWAIGEDGKIYRQVNQGEGWIEQGGCATAIANAGSDNVWVIGCDPPDANGNRGIYHRSNGSWERIPGYGVEIAVQADGVPWVLTNDGGVWRRR